MITGAGGSNIGSEIIEQVISNEPLIILLDSNEYALYEIKNEIESKKTKASVYSVIGNVIDKDRMKDLCLSF